MLEQARIRAANRRRYGFDPLMPGCAGIHLDPGSIFRHNVTTPECTSIRSEAEWQLHGEEPGVSRSSVQSIEAGRETVQLDRVLAIAETLGCELSLTTRSGAPVLP